MEKRTSLLWQLIFIILGCILLPGTLIGLMETLAERRSARQVFEKDMAQMSEVLAAATIGPLWDLNQQQANNILSKAMDYPGIRQIQIVDRSGQLFAHSTSPKYRGGPELSTINAPLIHQGELLGQMFFKFNEEDMKQAWNWQMGLIFLQGLFSAALSSVLVFFFFRQRVLLRLARLTKDAQDLQSDKLHQPFPWRAGDEVDLVGQTLELTRFKILENYRQLDQINAKLLQINHGLEKKVEERTAELVHAARLASVGEMAASVAHEINNPLTILLGRIEILRHKKDLATLDPAGLQNSLGSMERMVLRIDKIVQGLLTYCRQEDVHQRSELVITKILTSALELCSEQLKKSQVELSIGPLPSDGVVVANELQISQIFLNLINNSIDALAPLSQRWIKISFELVQESGQDFFQVSFQDSGPGISAEIQSKMMRPFFTTKEIGKGTGLGLSISSNIMAAHGGSLSYDQERGHTCFLLRFPLKTPGQRQLPLAS